MQTAFDIRVIALLSASMPLVLGMLMVIYSISRKTYHGFGYWIAANLCIGVGNGLIGFRHQIPAFFSTMVGNLLLVMGLILFYVGIKVFFNQRASTLWNHLIVAIYIPCQAFFTYIQPDMELRIVLFSAASSLLAARTAYLLFHHAPPKLTRISRITALIFLSTALIAVARGTYVLLNLQPIDVVMDMSFAMLSFGLILSIIGLSFFLFSLNSARLELELQESQQTLTGNVDVIRKKVVQLGLLEESGRIIVESLDEQEIIHRTIDAVVKQFDFAEAAISCLVEGDQLELVAIGGTEDVGFRVGYRQKIGEGIIGYTAQRKQIYLSGNIEADPYYYSIGKRSGSAVGIPMFIDKQLFGVLYVESTQLNAFSQDDLQTLETLVSFTVTAIHKARLYEHAQEQLRAISTLQTVSQAILSSLDLQRIFQSVVQALKDTYKYSYISIYTVEKDVLRLGAQVGYSEDMVIHEIPTSAGVAGRSLQTRQVQFIPDVCKEPNFLRASLDVASEICVPLVMGEKALGVLNVEANAEHPLDESDIDILKTMAGPVVIAIENANLHAEVTQLAMTDGLTRLANRRAFDQMLERELVRASRYHTPLSLIIIDMDFFKVYNDQWGHPAGDIRLTAVAELLTSGLRNPDFVARYGGEEFALILPNTNLTSALTLAERLRATAEKSAPYETRPGEPVAGYTFSMGVASFPDDGHDAHALLFAADQAELKAKKQGRNCICTIERCL